MNVDYGIINQQANQIGVIKKSNLRTFNPPEISEGINKKKDHYNYQNRDMQFVFINPVGYQGIKKSNLQTYNPPEETRHIKLVKREIYKDVHFENNPKDFRPTYN